PHGMNQLPPAPPAGQPGQPPIPPPQPVAIPVPMLPQPDFIRLSQGLLTVAQEIALVPNVPLQVSVAVFTGDITGFTEGFIHHYLGHFQCHYGKS
ncbi:hypothetical protein C0989_001187, partial [Termitomyces sp. Mn162]